VQAQCRVARSPARGAYRSNVPTSEDRAAEIVGQILDCPIERRDHIGAPDGTPDFEILAPIGPCPLEVTRSIDGEHIAMWRAIGGNEIAFPELKRYWHISIADRSSIKPLVKALREPLHAMERARIDSFEMDEPDEFGNTPDPSALWAPLAVVGVRRGRSFDVEPRGTVTIGSNSTIATAAEVLNGVAVTEIANNRSKLGRNGHLFIWVESSSSHAWLGMDLGPPEQPPAAFTSFTVWVARWDPRADEPDRFWRLSSESGWEDLTARLS
jgi:hypothetical protein